MRLGPPTRRVRERSRSFPIGLPSRATISPGAHGMARSIVRIMADFQIIQGGMGVDEIANGFGRQQHDTNSNDDGQRHDRQLLHQPDCSDHRIQ